jgi:L-malate glycosyltransferase
MQMAGRSPTATGATLAQAPEVPTTRIRIAVVITAFHPGGTERQMIELIRRLDPSRYDVRVACFHREGRWLPKVEQAVNELIELPLSSFGSPTAIGVIHQLRSWLIKRNIQVVQACDRYSNIVALPAAALAGTPARIGGRRELAPPGQTRAHVLLMRLAYRCAHRVVANSLAAANRLQDEGVDVSRIAVIPNGIDLKAFSERMPRQGQIVVATVANLRPGKGHDVLLEAAAMMLRRRPDVRFKIIGGGPLLDTLTARAAELGVANAVEFMGHREDVAAQLAASDLYVFPSLTEAFPNGLLEGMAAGLPIVASRAAGMTELIHDQHNGILVPPGDAEALAHAMFELVTDPVRAADLGRAARSSVQARYSFERMVASFEHIYLTELATRGGIRRAA